MEVYVLNKHGEPLMPCSPAKARKLLKNKQAKVQQRTPFVIQLLYGSSGYKQAIILGVDAGSKTVGLSAATETKELFAAEMTPRNDIVELLSTRREFRRSRRNRQCRYRPPRFDNRVHSKHKGWLAPSVEVKIQEHITAIKRVCKTLPISKVVAETAEFDLQLLKAMETGGPLPEGVEYQKGPMLGHYNTRQYVLFRDGYKCQCCNAHGKDIKLHVHHIESRKVGGDAPGNLITLCEHCHKLVHKGAINLKGVARRKTRPTRDAAFMGIMRKTFIQRLRSELNIPIVETRGYITKYTRVEILNLPKSHTNDALAIAMGVHGYDIPTLHKTTQRADRCYTIKPVRHHNRQLHKATILKGGKRKTNQAPKYVKEFRLFDKVLYNNQTCFVWGRRVTGSMLLRNLDGSLVKDGVGYKKLKLLERSSNYLIFY